MTREEVQPAWVKIVDIGFSNYSSLTRDQRVWFNIEQLTTDGLVSHYINHGANYNEETIEDLEYLGFTDIADQLRKVNELFSEGKPPKDIDERNDEWNSWCYEYEDILDEAEEYYWKRNDDLNNSLLEHIDKTGIGKE